MFAANATRALRERLTEQLNVKSTKKPQGAGLLEAVTLFLKHRPARCGICRPPKLSAQTRLVTIPFAAADGRPRDRGRHAAHLAVLLLRPDARG